jgi:hypothetical protein
MTGTRPIRLVRAAAGCLVVLAVTGGCAGEPPRIPSAEGWSGWVEGDVPAGHFPLSDEIRLCVDRPGEINVMDVSFEHSEGGVYIESFAVRPVTPEHGQWPPRVTQAETLWDLGFTPGETRISAVCDDRSRPASNEGGRPVDGAGAATLGLQVVKPTDGTGRGTIVRVTYRSGGREYVHRIGFELILCGVGAPFEGEECQERWGEYYDW